MELSSLVHPHHVEEAMRLFTAATVDASSNHANFEINEEEKKDVKDCETLIKQRVNVGGKVKKETLLKFMQDQQVELSIAKKTLMLMVRRMEFEETDFGTYKRVV